MGAKSHLIDLTCRTCGNSGNKVAILIPISALTVGRGNIAVRVDFVGCPCQIILRVDELPVFVIGQDIAQLADGQLSEGFMVEILFFYNVYSSMSLVALPTTCQTRSEVISNSTE